MLITDDLITFGLLSGKIPERTVWPILNVPQHPPYPLGYIPLYNVLEVNLESEVCPT